MRIGTDLYHLDELNWLSTLGIDVFLVHPDCLSTKTTSVFSKEELSEAVRLIHLLHKQIYVVLNTIIHEEQLPLLDDFLLFLKELEVDAIIIYDWTVFQVAQPLGLSNRIIYQPSTLTTNLYDPWFYEARGIKGLTLAREITLESINAILQNNHSFECSLTGHGYASMFYSYRPLITLFNQQNQTNLTQIKNYRYFSIEEGTRRAIHYPIYEDQFGTHIFRHKKLESFNEVEFLKPYLSDFFIDRFLLNNEELTDSISAYHNPKFVDIFRQKYKDQYDSGFYYRKTSLLRGDE